MTIEQIYETKGASYMEWLKENGGKREYRILEEKYPSHSLWYPQFKDEGRDWTHFTMPERSFQTVGMPISLNVLLSGGKRNWENILPSLKEQFPVDLSTCFARQRI